VKPVTTAAEKVVSSGEAEGLAVGSSVAVETGVAVGAATRELDGLGAVLPQALTASAQAHSVAASRHRSTNMRDRCYPNNPGRPA